LPRIALLVGLMAGWLFVPAGRIVSPIAVRQCVDLQGRWNERLDERSIDRACMFEEGMRSFF